MSPEANSISNSQAPLVTDPLAQMAIQEGSHSPPETEDELTLEFTDTETTMLRKLMGSLALSARILVESAMSYTYFYAQNHPLPEMPQVICPTSPLTVTLSLETHHKLADLNMADNPTRCAAIGIKLLYEHLIQNSATSPSHE